MIDSLSRPNPFADAASLALTGAAAPADSLREVLALLPVGVLLLDAQGRVQDANPVAIDLLGVPLLGQRWREVIARCFEPREDDGHEISLRDGRRVHISTRAMSDGLGQLVVISDLTETRALQARLARRDRLSSMGQLMASLAHQLRTPLSSALLCAHQLQRHAGQDAVPARHATRVIERLQHMERQIADMLLVAGGGNPKAEPILLNELMERLVEIYRPIAAQHGIRLRADGSLPDAYVIGNRDALLGALSNLIDNAIHACRERERDGREITLELRANGTSRACVVVRDNGIGMSKALQARLKEPYFTTKRTGTGLGLTVVQAVLDSHQGQLTITSTPGEGSAFSFELPMATVALAQAV